jgi:hypothetical protein
VFIPPDATVDTRPDRSSHTATPGAEPVGPPAGGADHEGWSHTLLRRKRGVNGLQGTSWCSSETHLPMRAFFAPRGKVCVRFLLHDRFSTDIK